MTGESETILYPTIVVIHPSAQHRKWNVEELHCTIVAFPDQTGIFRYQLASAETTKPLN
jgi:hypothetical protein